MRLREAPSAKRRSADSKVFRADRIVKIGGDVSGWVKGHRLYSRIDALQKIEGVDVQVYEQARELREVGAVRGFTSTVTC